MARNHPPSRFRKWLRTVVLFAIIVIVAWFVVVPQYGQAKSGIKLLEHISPFLFIVAALLEAASLMSFSALTAVLLGQDRPRYFTIFRIDLTDFGFSHIIPGGGTTAAAVRFRLLKEAGVSSTQALTTASIEIIVSNLMLGLVFLIGIVLSVTSLAFNKYYVLTAAIIFVILVLAAALFWLVTRHTQFVVDTVLSLARRFSEENKIKATNYITSMADEINKIRLSPKQLAAICLLGALNWVLDALALWVVLVALGYPLYIGSLVVAYGVASILALLPITPGGIGIIEGVLVPSLVGFGIPGPVALIGVIGWRILEYWLPIPVSVVSYLTLKFDVLK